MGLDYDRIKQRQAETQQSSGDRYKFKEGPNRVRIFKFAHKVTADDVKRGFFVKEKLGKEVEEIDRPVTVHFNVAKDNRPCESNAALVAEAKRLMNSRSEADQKRGKDIGPQVRYAVNLVDTEEKDAEGKRVMRHIMLPKGVYNSILGTVMDKDYGEAILGCEGRDFTITYDPKASGSDKYDVKLRDQDKCAKLATRLQKEVKDFYSEEGYAALGILPAPGAQAAETKAKATEKEEESEEEKDEEAVETKAETKAKPKSENKATGAKKPVKDEEDDLGGEEEGGGEEE